MKIDSPVVSIDRAVEYSLNVKRSRFLGYAEPVFEVEGVREVVSRVSRVHRDADHNCWAFKIGDDFGFSDGGEPSGTAGKPILGAIEKLGLNGVVVVVTRYFGGVKLGRRGLIDAYFTTAYRTLCTARKVKYSPILIVRLEMCYREYEKFLKSVSGMNVRFGEKNFSYDGLKCEISLLDADYQKIREKFGDSIRMEVVDRVFEPIGSS